MRTTTRSPVALVTGGSRGIGAQIVRLLAQQGYSVAFSYAQDRSAAQASADAARAASQGPGQKVLALQADVADPLAVATLFDRVEEQLGPLAALVNNAGITGPIGRFSELGADTMRRVIEVNLLGTMHCTQQAVRRWQARGDGGVMVNISSIAATLGAAGEYVHYAASKAAVETFTLGLAREVAAHGIRINAVSPGTTLTDIHAAAGEPDRPARVAARIPMQRAAQPDEIAEAVLWLLSDRASYVTASVLRVGGGL